MSEDGEPLSEFESQLSISPNPQEFVFDNVLMLDMSGSIIESRNLTELISAATTFVGNLADAGDVALYAFDGRPEPTEIEDFTGNENVLETAVDSLSDWEVVDDSTNLYGAVVSGLEILDDATDNEDHSAGTLTIFTDGTHRAGVGGEYPGLVEAKKAVRQSSHQVFTIGLGGEIDEHVLKELGSAGFAWAEDAQSLDAAFQDIAQDVSNLAGSYYSVAYCSPSRVGDHSLELRVSTSQGKDAVREKFNASGFEGGRDADADEYDSN